MQAIALAAALIVLNKSAHEAVLVHPTSKETLTRFATGQGPHEVAVSPDGARAYVSDYGAYQVFKDGSKSGPGKTITVLDLKGGKVAATWDLGEYTKPHGIAVSRDGKTVWVTVEGSKAVLDLDAATGRVRKAWKTGQDVSHMVVATPDEKKLYVANIGSGSVTIIDRAADKVQSVKTGPGAEGIDASPDGKEIWVGNREANTVSVIAVATDEVVASFASGGEMPIRVEFTPDGKQVLVSNAKSASVTVFDVALRKLVDTVEVGAVPVGIQLTPDGKTAYVANTNDDKVSVIDVASKRVIGSFSPGREPDGMAWVP